MQWKEVAVFKSTLCLFFPDQFSFLYKSLLFSILVLILICDFTVSSSFQSFHPSVIIAANTNTGFPLFFASVGHAYICRP